MSDLVTLTCEECGRDGDVKPGIVDMGSHRVAIEDVPGGTLIQWQEWNGNWYCHTCLVDAADGGEEHLPESVSGGGDA